MMRLMIVDEVNDLQFGHRPGEKCDRIHEVVGRELLETFERVLVRLLQNIDDGILMHPGSGIHYRVLLSVVQILRRKPLEVFRQVEKLFAKGHFLRRRLKRIMYGGHQFGNPQGIGLGTQKFFIGSIEK